MLGTNVRLDEPLDEPLDELSGISQAERIHVLRERMEAISATALHVGHVDADSRHGGKTVKLHSELGEIMPGGGLARCAITAMATCPMLVLEIVGDVTSHGGHVGVIGWPNLCFAHVSEYRDALSRLVLVPDPGLDPLAIAATLAEGLDLVFCYLPNVEVTPSRARPLLAKLRHGKAAVVLLGAECISPAARVHATLAGFYGVGQGTGRIRTIKIKVDVYSKGAPMRSTAVYIGAPLAVDPQPILRAV